MSDDIEMKDNSSAAANMHDTVTHSEVNADVEQQQPQHYLDSLPYLDTEYAADPNMQSHVQSLLAEEMSTLTRTPDEYLRDFMQHRAYSEVAYQRFETPLLSTAFATLASASSSKPTPTSALDLTRYKLEPPSSSSESSLPAWRAAIDNAESQLEHQSNRQMNLELLKKYGAHSWKVHNEQLTHVKQRLADSLASVKSDIEQLNRKRKSSQLAAGVDLNLLENGYYSLCWKNHEIEYACAQLVKKNSAASLGTHEEQPSTKVLKTSPE